MHVRITASSGGFECHREIAMTSVNVFGHISLSRAGETGREVIQSVLDSVPQ